MSEKFSRLAEVEAITGLKKTALYQLMAEGEFPRPYKLSGRAVGWKKSEIDEWIKSRQVA